MDGRKGKRVTSWILVYLVLIAAVVFTSQSGATTTNAPAGLSPVMLGGEAPALRLEIMANLSDI